MDLRELLTVLRARWVIIVVSSLVGGLVGLGLSLLAQPTYQARIQFYVTVAGGESAAAAAYQGSLGAQQRVQSYAALVKSLEVARQVIDEAGVEDIAPDELISQTAATADARTVLLEVSVDDSDPQDAFHLAEGFGQVLPRTINLLETPESGGPALAKLTVVNPPALPESPVSPRTELNAALGLIVGLAIGIGASLLVNMMDRRVRTREQLEEIAGKPVVGSIPFRKEEDKAPGDAHVVPFREGHSPAAEAFRRLRTNLQFLNVDNPPRVLVLTSSVAMEGKSESAVNLSIALAEAGSRVLLVEADLRRPRVVNYLAMPDKVGLTNVLSGRANFEDVVQETRYDGVQLLACGPLPPNPSELIASDTMDRLLERLRKEYDYVLIDSPPLLPVTDGAILAGITDGAILVVRSGRTTVDQVSQAVDNLRKADAKLLGLLTVANKPSSRLSSGYYDSYYYSSKAERAGGQA